MLAVESDKTFLERLEEAHEFPCSYTIKAIGKNTPEFRARIVGVARDHLQLDADPETSSRETQNGRHISITLSVTMPDAPAVISLYEQLQNVDGLKLLI